MNLIIYDILINKIEIGFTIIKSIIKSEKQIISKIIKRIKSWYRFYFFIIIIYYKTHKEKNIECVLIDIIKE